MLVKGFRKFVFILLILIFVIKCAGWKAVPANQAVYALRQKSLVSKFEEEDAGVQFGSVGSVPDELLPRTFLHSNYKFGWCTRDTTVKQYLRKTVNMTFSSYTDTKVRYIYLLDHKHTQRFHLQCVMMKIYVPRKYLFKKSRLPMYYCQGLVYLLILNTIQKIEIHEFYIQTLLHLPANFVFEFYHAPPL